MHLLCEMRLSFKTWSDFHHQIYQLYHGIIALSLVPFSLVFLEFEVTSIDQPRVSEILILVILFISLPLCGYISWEVWRGNRFVYTVRQEDILKQKLLAFRKMEVKRYLWLEVASIIALAGLWLTAHYLFVICYFAILVQFSLLRPSEDRLVRLLHLNKAERSQLHIEDYT